jgi:putative tricarboxylic transport membrane protein
MKPGHVLLLLFILGWTGWYLTDALRVSWNIRNIILIVPLAGIVLVAALYELAKQAALGLGWLQTSEPDAASGGDPERSQSRGDLIRGMVLLSFLGVLVFSMSTVGFDVAIFAFILASLMLLESGKYLGKLFFAAVFTFVVVSGARFLLPFPMHTIFL